LWLRMQGRSWIDRLAFTFHHRWETDAHYRAVVSGFAGLLVVVAVCSCLVLVSSVTGAVLARMGLTGSQTASFSGSQNTGTQQLHGLEKFPTPTFGQTSQNQPPPVGTIPSSQTPVPSPTDLPSPTPLPTTAGCGNNCQGGGGGNGGGAVGSVTISGSPDPWIAGQQDSVVVHTSLPNIPIGIIVSNLPGGGTALQEGQYNTDSSGNYTYTFNCPASTSSGTAKVTVILNWPGGTQYYDHIQKYVP